MFSWEMSYSDTGGEEWRDSIFWKTLSIKDTIRQNSLLGNDLRKQKGQCGTTTVAAFHQSMDFIVKSFVDSKYKFVLYQKEKLVQKEEPRACVVSLVIWNGSN